MNKGLLTYTFGVFVLLIFSCHVIWGYADLPKNMLPLSFIARLCTPLIPLICIYLFPISIAAIKRKIEFSDIRDFSFLISIVLSVCCLVSMLSIQTNLRKITAFGKLRPSLSVAGYSIESDLRSPVDQILSLRLTSDEEKIHLLEKLRPYYTEDIRLEQSLRNVRKLRNKENRWENLGRPLSRIDQRERANTIYKFLSKKLFHQALRQAQGLALETSQESVVYKRFIKAFRKERFFLGHYLSRQPIFEKEYIQKSMLLPTQSGKNLHVGTIYRYDNRCFLENWMIDGGKSIPYGLLTQQGTILLPGDTETYDGFPLMIQNDPLLANYVHSSELQHSQDLFPYMLRTWGELLWHYKTSIPRLEGLEGEWNYKLSLISKPFWYILLLLYFYLHVTMCCMVWSVLLNPITLVILLTVPFCLYWGNHWFLLRIVSFSEGYWTSLLPYCLLYATFLLIIGSILQQITQRRIRLQQSHCNRQSVLWLKSR